MRTNRIQYRFIVTALAIVVLAALATLSACTPPPDEADTGDAVAQAGATEDKETEKPTETPTPTETTAPTDTPEPTETPEPTATTESQSKSPETEGTEPTGPTIDLVLENDLDVAVCYVYISLPSDTSWGDDQLGSTEIVEPGATRTFAITAGEWDLLTVDCDGEPLTEEYGVMLEEDTTWTVTDSGTASEGVVLTLTNDSSIDVCYVYISPSDSTSWGDDWLGTDIVHAGTGYAFRLTPGTYDLLSQDCEGNELATEFGVDISEAMTWTLSDEAANGDAQLVITNHSDREICYLYISPSSSSEWGGDWLGGDSIYMNGYMEYHLPADTYDMIAQDCAYETVAETYGLTVEGVTTWEITEAGFSEESGPIMPMVLTLENQTNKTVCTVWIGQPESEWAGDLLESQDLPAGETVYVDVVPDTWALQAEDCSGNVMQYDPGFFVHQGAVWTITP